MVGLIELAVALAAASVPSGSYGPPKDGFCVECHRGEKDDRLRRPAELIPGSVHAEVGGSCVICHGGDPREPTKRAHQPSLGFRGRPRPQDIPGICGGCHADAAYMRRFNATISVDQLALYAVSDHGKALAKGEVKAATCISCHTAHEVRGARDPAAPVNPKKVALTCSKCHSDHDHPAYARAKIDPYPPWTKSVHARAMFEKGDLSAPTCNDCHGDHGATPPGVVDIHRTCGRCHAEESARFMKSVHVEPFAELGFGECRECHGDHEIKPAPSSMLTPTEDGACVRCHEGDRGSDAAAAMLATIGEAEQMIERTRATVKHTQDIGLLVDGAETADKDLYTSMMKMRIAVHDMRPEGLEPEMKVIRATCEKVIADCARALDELKFRRRGYFVFIGIISAVVGLLIVKLRRLTP